MKRVAPEQDPSFGSQQVTRRKSLIAVGIAAAVTVIAGAACTANDARSDESQTNVPGLGVTVSGVPSGWSMHPAGWDITRLEGGGVLAATATWWPDATSDSAHNTFGVCVERINQSMCPTQGDSVVATRMVGDDKRMSISILERTPQIVNERDEQEWQKVSVN